MPAGLTTEPYFQCPRGIRGYFSISSVHCQLSNSGDTRLHNEGRTMGQLAIVASTTAEVVRKAE